MDDGFFMLMVGKPTIVMLEMVKVVLPSSSIYAVVEEFGVGTPTLQVCNAGTLLLPTALNHR